MNCRDCIFFSTKDGVYGLGKCSNPKILDDMKRDVPIDEIRKDCIYATCDETRGEMLVGPDFGCIHFRQIVRS